MNTEQAIDRLLEVVDKKLRHKHYTRTTERATLYGQLVAGIGIDKLLRQFVRRETRELFEQRVRLTQHLVTAVCANLFAIFRKVPRSNAARRVLEYQSDDQGNRKAELEGLLRKFWGNASFDDYMAVRFAELNETDPNAFVVFEWDAFDASREMIQPRPFEVKSDAAVDYLYDNRVLQYLTVRQAIKIGEPTNLKDGERYTMYAKDQTFTLTQIPDTGGRIATDKQITVSPDGTSLVKLDGKIFRFDAYEPHNLDAVPAFRVGYNRDPHTDGETFVNPLHAVEPLLLKTIKVNSELDLVASLLAFPQPIMRGEDCPDVECLNGIYQDGSTCPTCDGTGFKATAMSAQDAIVAPKARSREELIPLTEYMSYLHPPVDIIRWQDEYLTKLTKEAKLMLFNSDQFDSKQVAETAHGKQLDMQNVYDTLYPYAQRYGKVWTFGVNLMAKLASRESGLAAAMTFGKDFKLKTVGDLMAELREATETGATVLIKHLTGDIARIVFSEQPQELYRYQLQEAYNPFSGKTEKEIILLMASPYISRAKKVLYANYGHIFDQLEAEYAGRNVNFYELDKPKQQEAIDRKVSELIETLDAEAPLPLINLDAE